MTAFHLNATLLPEGQETTDLWVAGGRITFDPLEDAADLAPKGGFALVGLVDCHAHLTLDVGLKGLEPGSAELVEANRQDHLAAGTLLIRDIGTVSDATLHLPWDDGLPKVIPASLFLAPQEGGPFPLPPVPPERLPEVAVEQLEAGARWVKIMADWPGGLWPEGGIPDFGRERPNYPREALDETVDAVHRGGGRVAVHTFGREGAARSVAARVDSVEHGWGLDEDILRAMADQGIGWTPTLAMGPPLAQLAEDCGKPHVADWIRETVARLRKLVVRGAETGVPILAGTDILPHGSLAQEVAALHQSGLEPRQALGAASSEARAFLGAPSLEEGAAADLVLYPADPRESPGALARPSLVVLDGRVVQRKG